ncbi:MAG: hypothetical protein MSR29_07240 [Lachnospiraceae bacterium]|nr:hypothetical protein [Lachnospiraceae bacterium]
MSKIIKVSTDLKITVHDFPEGTISEQNRQLCELIGNGCSMIENVMPKRLYTGFGHTTHVTSKDSKCVSMLVDEEFLFRSNSKPNLIGSYMYETDKHKNPILGNVLFVGNEYKGDGISFCGIERGTFDCLYKQLIALAEIATYAGAVQL